MEKPIKQKKCKICKSEFTPQRPLQIACSYYCAIKHSDALKARKNKEEEKKTREKFKTHSEHLKELQVIFNTYIRERDKVKNCISCDKPLTGKYDAGHFYSVGAYPNLRFNEDNVHGQCVACNQHRHGNIHEYGLRLPFRIGGEKFLKLQELRKEPLKLSLPEIEVLKIKYKEKTKILRNGRS